VINCSGRSLVRKAHGQIASEVRFWQISLRKSVTTAARVANEGF
jgi:hypothetical protein